MRECLLFYMCLQLPLNLAIKLDIYLHLGHNISYSISCPFYLSKIVCYYVIGYVLFQWRNTKKKTSVYIQFVTQALSHTIEYLVVSRDHSSFTNHRHLDTTSIGV